MNGTSPGIEVAMKPGLTRLMWYFSKGFCGIMSILSSMRYLSGDQTRVGNLWAALAFLPFGLFFDFMDGKVARWRKKSSMMGQELDSLADLVRFPFASSPPCLQGTPSLDRQD